MELDDVVLYQDDSGNSTVMSERVTGLASSIYREFERLIEKYDEDVVKELMPLVVAVLENLDSVFAVNQEHEVDLELLKEDNEQLVTQYEREKALRKHAEERYIAFEDSLDGEKKDLQRRLESLESHTRHLELKTKNYAEQISRLEEREAELKKEYNTLHQRHTEMIHSYMEHLERTKHQHMVAPAEPSDAVTSARTRKERPISMGIFQLPGTDGVTPDLHREPTDPSAEPWRFNNLSHPQSNTSLKDEFAGLTPSKSSSPNSKGGAQGGGPSQDVTSKSNTSTSPRDGKSSSMSSASGQAGGNMSTTPLSTTPLSTTASDVTMESVNSPLQEQEGSDRINKNLDQNSGKPESNKNISVVQGGQQESTPLKDGAENAEKSEVQKIIESTPELNMDLEGCRGTSTPAKGGIENLAFDRNTDSLFEELSSAGNDLIGDVDEGADLLGMGREVEHLIHENTQLLETKNALNVVKNDLISRVDELSCEKDVLQGELEALSQAKGKLEERNKELEEELRKVRAELEESKHKVKNDNEDDSDVPTAQRKRFTRVEMARVLMERNQYKERLMELQEAVRWTEMIRASKENPSLPEKKKSSLWQFFSRLFSSSGAAAKKPATTEAPVNVKYNAPTSQIQPSVKKRSSALQQLPSDKSKAFDFLNEEVASDKVVSRREQKREQYKQVKAHVQKEDGRVQAYGWSLPKKYKVNGGQTESKMKNLPVPVFLRPLDEKDASMKLWCAAGVNLSGGKTRDGGSIVGASVFYSDVPGPESPTRGTGSQTSLDKLDQDLKEQQKELRQQDELSSLVWICTSTQSTTKVVVIDANQPGNILESFFICDSHVLCIASVPGARETDYPAGEEVPSNCHAGPAGDDGSSVTDVSSAGGGGGGGVLGGITVVGCAAEGSAAVPQTADGAGGDGESESRAAAEEATEAMEVSAGMSDHRGTLRGVYTEHVFTDPLGAQQTPETSETPETSGSYTQRESDLLKDGVSSDSTAEEHQDLMMEEAQKMSSVLPTMWLGAQNGCVYVHSSVAQWKKCLHSIKLKDSVLGIVHVKGRVLVGLADGTLAVFHRGVDGQWDLTNYHLIDLGRPHHSIRCMTVVHDKVWCGYRNKIYVVQPKAMKIEKSFDAHPRKDSQVRQLAWDGDGIWVSIRLDSTLRLFHAHTFQHLQDVDIEPYVSKMLGTGKLGFSFVRITALMVSCNRLWIGTGNGVIISIPLTESAAKAIKAAGNHPGSVVRVYGDDSGDKVTAGTFVPYCSMAHAQLCFHGHRDAVKFFSAVPGHAIPSSSCGGETPGDKASDASSQEGTKSMLVMSGGEGYIDFRMGDEDGEADAGEDVPIKLQPFLAKAERSHLIVWQVLVNDD
ncbi:C-Jun-amino-terminal kinase-interacting protein 4-like isoform X1 [Solea senegalensis]|uniref:C-Jun-amino-terminal kinase-interacting protein 4 n=1 Tax=Solea senegalensis TaxID=28829 RepID=A0AAV6RNK7_SOLSE|nr:C-Jun-amino-terminal kinase-interacting protein 4 isoform X2 [Solea senegalensis]KAG7506991.1 C-Jun-amino-terminal kinase-interacting protein 4-like isoform X1 [Solea senegalensis]